MPFPVLFPLVCICNKTQEFALALQPVGGSLPPTVQRQELQWNNLVCIWVNWSNTLLESQMPTDLCHMLNNSFINDNLTHVYHMLPLFFLICLIFGQGAKYFVLHLLY